MFKGNEGCKGDRGWDGLWVGTAPRAVLGECRVRITEDGLEGGREANRYPPIPIRYSHWVGAWFTAPSYGGGHGEALPLPETEVEKGAKRGSGKLATQSRNYLERVAADSGWRMGK